MLKDEGLWGTTKEYPYRSDYDHNWIERRVNELVKEEFGPKVEGKLKIVCVSKKRGTYEPNPALFQ